MVTTQWFAPKGERRLRLPSAGNQLKPDVAPDQMWLRSWGVECREEPKFLIGAFLVGSAARATKMRTCTIKYASFWWTVSTAIRLETIASRLEAILLEGRGGCGKTSRLLPKAEESGLWLETGTVL